MRSLLKGHRRNQSSVSDASDLDLDLVPHGSPGLPPSWSRKKTVSSPTLAPLPSFLNPRAAPAKPHQSPKLYHLSPKALPVPTPPAVPQVVSSSAPQAAPSAAPPAPPTIQYAHHKSPKMSPRLYQPEKTKLAKQLHQPFLYPAVPTGSTAFGQSASSYNYPQPPQHPSLAPPPNGSPKRFLSPIRNLFTSSILQSRDKQLPYNIPPPPAFDDSFHRSKVDPWELPDCFTGPVIAESITLRPKRGAAVEDASASNRRFVPLIPETRRSQDRAGQGIDRSDTPRQDVSSAKTGSDYNRHLQNYALRRQELSSNSSLALTHLSVVLTALTQRRVNFDDDLSTFVADSSSSNQRLSLPNDENSDDSDGSEESEYSSRFSFIESRSGGRNTSVKYYKTRKTPPSTDSSCMPPPADSDEGDISDYDYDNNGYIDDYFSLVDDDEEEVGYNKIFGVKDTSKTLIFTNKIGLTPLIAKVEDDIIDDESIIPKNDITGPIPNPLLETVKKEKEEEEPRIEGAQEKPTSTPILGVMTAPLPHFSALRRDSPASDTDTENMRILDSYFESSRLPSPPTGSADNLYQVLTDLLEPKPDLAIAESGTEIGAEFDLLGLNLETGAEKQQDKDEPKKYQRDSVGNMMATLACLQAEASVTLLVSTNDQKQHRRKSMARTSPPESSTETHQGSPQNLRASSSITAFHELDMIAYAEDCLSNYSKLSDLEMDSDTIDEINELKEDGDLDKISSATTNNSNVPLCHTASSVGYFYKRANKNKAVTDISSHPGRIRTSTKTFTIYRDQYGSSNSPVSLSSPAVPGRNPSLLSVKSLASVVED